MTLLPVSLNPRCPSPVEERSPSLVSATPHAAGLAPKSDPAGWLISVLQTPGSISDFLVLPRTPALAPLPEGNLSGEGDPNPRRWEDNWLWVVTTWPCAVELYTWNLRDCTNQGQPDIFDLKTKKVTRVLAAILQSGCAPRASGKPGQTGSLCFLPPVGGGGRRGCKNAPSGDGNNPHVAWQCQPAPAVPPPSPPRTCLCTGAGSCIRQGGHCACAHAPGGGAGPLFSAPRPCPGGSAPAFSPSTRFFPSFSEGQVWTVALGTVRQEIWGRNQAIVPFLRREMFLPISACPEFYYLNVPSQEQQQMRTF